MNYLVIDLEMCKVPKNYRGKNYKYASEIIQVGAVLLDEEYKEIGTLCQYVHPEFGILDYFITNLTGIEKGQIKNAPKLKDALIHMADWLGEREYKVFAWSKSDYWQLDHEITSPKKNVYKRYFAVLDSPAQPEDIEAFAAGMEFSDFTAKSAYLEITDNPCEVYIEIAEGKFHQVKRMCARVGKNVVFLKRVAIGSLMLDEELAVGEVREMSREEVGKALINFRRN